jgi:serine/threonine-protein kinase
METKNVDQNVMLALVALKMGLIDNEAMVAALNTWAEGKDRSVGRILVAQEAVAEARLFLAEQTMSDLLDSSGGDPQTASMALRLPMGLVETNLERVSDPDLRAALARLEPAEAGDRKDRAADPLKTEFDPKLAAGAARPRTTHSDLPSSVITPRLLEPDTALSEAPGAGPATEAAPVPGPGAADSCATADATGEWSAGRATEPDPAAGNGRGPQAAPESDLFATASLNAAPETVEVGALAGEAPTQDLPRTQPLAGPGMQETTDLDATPASASVRVLKTMSFPPGPAAGPIRYRSLRPHAKGGLGEVFLAMDEELGREVALKEIQGRHADRPESRARFLIEAEVTGGLEHPGIVPVYGLGQYPDGRPYYAMRFIRGRTLKDAIDDYHDADGEPHDPGERTLELRALLNRLIDVCNALAYAHTRGILHRDIKPANIMLGSFGETLVVDWGLAKTLDRPETPSEGELQPLRPLSAGASGTGTMYGSTVGTPNFMSPEQAAGQLDRLGPASDVYSIGTTLYCILTGRPPFHEPALGLLLQKVRAGQFPRPRAVNRQVPPALEAICLKAMALMPEDRYHTARLLADDLEHWLADEPVSVYPEPWTVRLARWARRHKTLVTTSAALVLTATVALAIGTVMIQREKARTEANFQLARAATDEMLTKLAEVELADVPQMETVRRNMFGQALKFYQKFLAQRGQDRSIRQETGRANLRLGDIEEMLGDYVAAEAAYDRAINLLAALAADQPGGGTAAVRRDLASARHKLGMMLKKSNRLTEAEKALREAERLRGELVAADPDNAADQADATATAYQLGTVLARLGRVKEVETAYGAAVDAERKRAAAHPDRPGYSRELARYLNNRGILQRATLGDQKVAEASFREALGLQKTLAEKSPTVAGLQWERARTTSNLAGTLMNTQGAALAVPVYREALGLLKQLADDYPTVPDYQNELAVVSFNLGMLYIYQAEHQFAETKDAQAAAPVFAQAREQIEGAIAIYRRLIQPERFPHRPDFTLRLAQAEIRRAILEDQYRTAAEVEPLFREAVQFLDALVAQYPQVPEYQSDLGTALQNLAMNRLRANQAAEASRLLDAAIAHQRVALESNRKNSFYRKFVLDAFGDLETALAQQSDHTAVAKAAETLIKLLPDDPRAVFRSAHLLDSSATLAAAAKDIPDADRPAVVRARAELALKRLQQAVKDGMILAPQTLDAPAFGAIRAQSPESLEALRKTLEARVTPKVG